MTVSELIERLKSYPQEATVIMCMDWTGSRDRNKPKGQWEDDLGDIVCANKGTAKWVYLLNESFK